MVVDSVRLNHCPVCRVQMLIDTLDVLDLDGRRSGTETQVGGYDLVWHDGPVSARATEVAAEGGGAASAGAAHTPQGSPLGSYMAPPGPAAVAAAAAATASKGRH